MAVAIVKVFVRAGFYNTVRTDLGTEFVNSLHEELYKVTGTVHVKTLAYSPNQNPVERSHRTINAMLGKLIDRHSQWSNHMDYVAAAYNATVQRTTGFTPNFLHFGRELASNVSVLLAGPTVSHENYGKFAADLMERLSSAHELARSHLNQSAMQANRWYDKKVRLQSFEPGDKILIYCPRKRKNCYAKWQRLYAEEASVMKRVNDVTYIVKPVKTGKPKIVHVDKMKLLSAAVREAEATAGNRAANGQ